MGFDSRSLQLLSQLFTRTMEFYSNSQIIDLLNERPGRMKNFLLEVPINQIRDALEQHQRLADLRYHNSNLQNAYKHNVLDFTLSYVIKACKDEKLINYFQYKLALQQTRIQNHSSFGRKLVNRLPEKYYVGEESHHHNHARQIEESYGIFNYLSEQQQEEQQSQNQDRDNEDQQNNNPDQQKNVSQFAKQSSQKSFIIDDQHDVEFEYIDSVAQKIDELDQQSEYEQRKQVKKRDRPTKIIKKPTKSKKEAKFKRETKSRQSKEKIANKPITRIINNKQKEVQQDLSLLLEEYLVQSPEDQQEVFPTKVLPRTKSSKKNSKWLVESDSD